MNGEIRLLVRKEVSRISRALIEIAIETHKCFTELTGMLGDGKGNSKKFLESPEGYLHWLTGITDFTKQVKKHLQEGRMNLLNFLGEETMFYKMAQLHKNKIEKKSHLSTELQKVMDSILENNRITKLSSKLFQDENFKKYVTSVEPAYIETQKEPIDIAHLEDQKFLIGCFDGSMLLRDVSKPEDDIVYDKHLKNRATWIRSIIVDSSRKTWVATSNGISVYNKAFRVVMSHLPYDEKVKFFGHFRILWVTKNRRFIFWWCDRGSIKIFDSKTWKLLMTFKNFLQDPEERPNHYCFLDGKPHKIFIVTNNNNNSGSYYILDVRKRKVTPVRDLPVVETHMHFAHVCVAYDCPSDCIVTTGVSSVVEGDMKKISSKEELSHISVFKTSPDDTVELVDRFLNPELRLMTIASIIFHTPNHTRILSVLTKHIYVVDLIGGKLKVLFSVKDINRGECVHQMIRLKNSYLFVGNYGQIFKIGFSDSFFDHSFKIDEEDDKEIDIYLASNVGPIGSRGKTKAGLGESKPILGGFNPLVGSKEVRLDRAVTNFNNSPSNPRSLGIAAGSHVQSSISPQPESKSAHKSRSKNVPKAPINNMTDPSLFSNQPKPQGGSKHHKKKKPKQQ